MSRGAERRAGDPVAAFLKDRGCPDFVVEGGLEGLLASWERTVAEIAQGYRGGLDDYLNDLDARQLLDDALPQATSAERGPLRSRLDSADARFKSLVEPVTECLWGAPTARRRRWSPLKEWWYFSAPRSPGAALAEDLAGRAGGPGAR